MERGLSKGRNCPESRGKNAVMMLSICDEQSVEGPKEPRPSLGQEFGGPVNFRKDIACPRTGRSASPDCRNLRMVL